MRRIAITIPFTPEERRAIMAAVGGSRPGRKGQGLSTFISTAVLSFDRFDRAEQSEAILASQPSHKWSPKDHWAVNVHPLIAELIHAWRFSMFSQGRVLRGAILQFLQLAPDVQAEWHHELLLFLSSNEVPV